MNWDLIFAGLAGRPSDPPFFATPTGIAIIAASSSFVAGVLGAVISSLTIRKTNKEKIAADDTQAEMRFKSEAELTERKIDAEIKSVDRKIDAEIKLTSKKFELDRAMTEWRRRVDLGEEVLADFYKAAEIFDGARSLFIRPGEGANRPRMEGETEEDALMLTAVFVPFERLAKKADFLSNMQSKKYKCAAVFGDQAIKPFEELLIAFREIKDTSIALTQDVINKGSSRREPLFADILKKYDYIIGFSGAGPDPIKTRIGKAVAEMERICRSNIQAPPQ